MLKKTIKSKITIIVPGKCQECGCQVTPKNVGFECDTFVVCKKCNKEAEEDWDTFQTEMQEEEEELFE